MTKAAGDGFTIDAKEAAEMLGVSEQTIRRKAEAELIRHARIGTGSKRKYLFRREDLEDFQRESFEVFGPGERQDETESSADRQTNPLIDEVYSRNKKPFRGWTKADWSELYSQHGDGGALTESGVLAAAEEINTLRDMRTKFEVVARSEHVNTLKLFLDSLYSQVKMATKQKR